MSLQAGSRLKPLGVSAGRYRLPPMPRAAAGGCFDTFLCAQPRLRRLPCRQELGRRHSLHAASGRLPLPQGAAEYGGSKTAALPLNACAHCYFARDRLTTTQYPFGCSLLPLSFDAAYQNPTSTATQEFVGHDCSVSLP